MLGGVLTRMGRLLCRRSIWMPAVIWQGAMAALHAPRDLLGTTEVMFVTLLTIMAVVAACLGAWMWLSMVATGVAISIDPLSDWQLVDGVIALRVLATVCILAVPIIGSVPLAAIPSIYLLGRWQMTIPVILEHDPGLRESMEESSNLARGYIPQILILWLSFATAAWFAHSGIAALALHSAGRFAAERLWASAVWLGSAVLLTAIYGELTTIDLEDRIQVVAR